MTASTDRQPDRITDPVAGAAGTGAEAQIAQYGIVRVPADHYEVDGFRYTNLRDAVAQAQRSRAS